MVADPTSGLFTLAGGALAAAAGGVTEYARERWARSRDRVAREEARKAARDEFQRQALVDILDGLRDLQLALTEAMLSATPTARASLRRETLSLGTLNQRVFDAEARAKVQGSLGRATQIYTALERDPVVSEEATDKFVEALYAATEAVRELLDKHY